MGSRPTGRATAGSIRTRLSSLIGITRPFCPAFCLPGLATLLALALGPTPGPAALETGGPRADRDHRPRGPALGHPAHPRRAAQTGDRGQRPLHPPLPPAWPLAPAQPELAHVSRQPRPGDLGV